MEKIKRFCRENARILLALGAVLAFCAVLPVMFAATAVPTGSWGLSFRTEGQPPVGNATAGALRQYDAVYVGDTEEKVIYLTFDAGYEAGYTEQILDVLKKHDVKAAFFVVGTYIENNPELVRRMAEEGHIVGNHTWHHYICRRSPTCSPSRANCKASPTSIVRPRARRCCPITGRRRASTAKKT